MAQINDHYLKLRASYLFSETGRRVREFQAAHPNARVIRLGIGDVTRPLPAAATSYPSIASHLPSRSTLSRSSSTIRMRYFRVGTAGALGGLP